MDRDFNVDDALIPLPADTKANMRNQVTLAGSSLSPHKIVPFPADDHAQSIKDVYCSGGTALL